MARGTIIALLCIFPAVGFGQSAPVEYLAMQRAWHRQEMSYYQQLIADQMKDPGSAMFRDVWIAARKDQTVFICGEINARGPAGGYVGFNAFAAEISGTFPQQNTAVWIETDKALEKVRVNCRINAPR